MKDLPVEKLSGSVCLEAVVVVCVIVICSVSDVIAGQSEWSFAKTPPLLTALFCKVNDFYTL